MLMIDILELNYEGGGGRESSGVVPLVLGANASDSEQRLSGARLFIQNARNLHTKIMSNGVEVIVRGDKTALAGFQNMEKSWLPQKTSPMKPVTLPAYTVSRLFHLRDKDPEIKPGGAGIGQLLSSIVRSATPDLVTKTLLTTFTYKTTILKRSNTIVKSHEEVVSNVMTQRFQSQGLEQMTKSAPPQATEQIFNSQLSTSHVTQTMFTTYIIYNTFTGGTALLPMILTSRETISNVKTLPAYLVQPTPIISTRVFETETHYSTYTFSKTLRQKETEKVVTTRETVTQVVITESMAPLIASQISTVPQLDASPQTYYTTFTHLVTERGPGGDLVVRSSTSITSKVLQPSSSSGLKLTTTIHQTKTLTPVILYATKVYYTTYTYFTTMRNKGETLSEPKIHSRTQVVSRVATEALETAFDINYVSKLKSSYLAKHSTVLDVSSFVQEIIPTRTIELIQGTGTLVTQKISLPHWPKDDEQLAHEIQPHPAIASLTQKVGTKIKGPLHSVTRHPIIISSSEEHFDEVKEGVHKIVSVLTNTQVSAGLNGKVQLQIQPTQTFGEDLSPTSTISTADAPEAFVEEITLGELDGDFSSSSTSPEEEAEQLLTERPVSHLPTPPLINHRTSTERSEPTSKGPGHSAVDLDIFPDIGPKPVYQPATTDNLDLDYPDEDSLTKKSSERNETKEILNLISEIASEAEEVVSEEDSSGPLKIYNIPATFDTEAYNVQNMERANATKNNNSSSEAATIEDEELISMATEPVNRISTEVVDVDDETGDEIYPTNATLKEDLEIIPDFDLDLTGNGNVTEEDGQEVITELPNLDDFLQSSENDTSQLLNSDDDNFSSSTDAALLSLSDILDSEEVNSLLTNPPNRKKNKNKTKNKNKVVTTTPKPKKKKNNTKRPQLFSDEEENSPLDSSTPLIYALGPIRFSGEQTSASDEGREPEDEEDAKQDERVSEENSSESEEKHKKKKKHGPSIINGGYSGPSKSAISFPAAATSSIATAATSSFNWKPLLNLGAIGLGGLGASTLTKLGPLFNSVAGSFLKGSMLPIARNDTQYGNNNNNNKISYKNPKKSEKGRRPYYNPPKEAPVYQHNNEPIYIPLQNHNNMNNNDEPYNNYRFSDGHAVRRPNNDHNNNNNFHEPDMISGPLPPPIRHQNDDHWDLPNFFQNDHNQYHDHNEQPPQEHSNYFGNNGPQHPRPPVEHSEMSPEGKTDFILRPFYNILGGARPTSSPSKRPGVITPILRPMEQQKPILLPPMTPSQGFKPRPGPASIEMINEIKDTHPKKDPYPSDNPQIFLPQRNPNNNRIQQQHQYPGPLRINIPGLNLHSNNGDGLPWGPLPPGNERFGENPFKNGNLNPPRIQNEYENNAEAASHESFEPHHGHNKGHVNPEIFNHQGFITKDHFNEITKPQNNNAFHPKPIFDMPSHTLKTPSGYVPPQIISDEHNNIRPQQRPIFPPQTTTESEEVASGSQLDNNNNNNRHLEQFERPIWKQENNENNNKRGPGSPKYTTVEITFDDRRPNNNNKLPPWPNSGPGPGQFPGRFPAPMNILNDENRHGIDNPNIDMESENEVLHPKLQPRPPIINRRPAPPSTVYIVEEDLRDEEKPNPPPPVQQSQPQGDISNHNTNGESRYTVSTFPSWTASTKRQRITSTSQPTTTSASTTTISNNPGGGPTTNRALISRLFIRRFTTTTTPSPNQVYSSSTISNRILPSWALKTRATSTPGPPTTTTTNKPTIQKSTNNFYKDLLSFEEKFKQKYGSRKPGSGNINSAASQTVKKVMMDAAEEEEEDEEEPEYSDELDYNNNHKQSHQQYVNQSDHNHPNHHPIHKPPIDVNKYLKNVDEDEFGQLYQGTEDQDTIIDPVNQQIIKSPLNSTSKFSHRTSTTVETVQDSDEATTINMYTLGESEEEQILKKFQAPQDLVVFASTPPGNSKLWWPTTIKPTDLDKPTTFRPSEKFLNDILPAASSNSNSNHPRPAPQAGMASFYDDDEATRQIKMKNTEIHKLQPPPFTKLRPNSGIALVKPEDLVKYEESVKSSKETRDKLNKGAQDKIKEYPEFPETEREDSSGYEDESLEKPATVWQSSVNVQPPRQPLEKNQQDRPVSEQKTNIQIVQPPQNDNGNNGGHRESSYIYEDEYYEDGEDENNQIPETKSPGPILKKPNPAHGKIIFQQRPPKPPQNIGGHMANNNINFNRQQPPPNSNINNNRFIQYRPPANIPKTEMEPPPIDSNRLKQPVLELPSSGPIRYQDHRPQQGQDLKISRPNLLRPVEELFKNDEKKRPNPAPTVHTIASVDDNNEIIGTNTFTAILPSNNEENIKVVTPSKVSPVIKYTGGRLQTTVLTEDSNGDEDEDGEYEEDSYEQQQPIEPSKSSAVTPLPPIQRTREAVSMPPPTTRTPLTTSTTEKPSASSNIPTRGSTNIRDKILNRQHFTRLSTSTQSPQSSTTTKPVIRRPFIPTRGAGPNIVPWARRPQGTSTIRPTVTSQISKSETKPVLQLSPVQQEKTTTTTAASGGSSSKPTTTVISTSVSATSSESGSGSTESGESSSPSNSRPTNFRQPPSSPRQSLEQQNKLATLISRFVPSTRRPPASQTVPSTPISTSTTTTNRTTTSTTKTTTPLAVTPPNIESDEYEEYSYEEGTESPLENNTNAGPVNDPDKTKLSKVPPPIVEIVPTRTNNNNNYGPSRGGSRFRNSQSTEEPSVTRYVTFSETVTLTETETETATLSSRGIVRTQTILITKTIPPQTLVSTIVGTVTLVNTLDIQPTVVRTTIVSEPTRIVPINTFVDTSESTSIVDKAAKNGIVLKGNFHRPSSTQYPRPPTKIPIEEIDDCSANCSLNSNQNLACRIYANGTRSKCDCKPGYARMKAKYPCRPTFTYEMRLGINHMDGMLFDFKDLYNAGTEGYLNFITVTKEAIDKAFLATDIKRQFQGSEIFQIYPLKENVSEPRVDIDFLVQLTTNITEDRIKNHLIRTLKNSNYSIGRTGILSTREVGDFNAQDFNECDHIGYNDCSLYADCLNIRGSFTCKCRPGFRDRSSKRKPGRECQETSGCSECNFKGTCHTDSKGIKSCHCFRWYGGSTCQINLKFLLIAITGIGSILFILVMLCGTLICRKGSSSEIRRDRSGSGRFMRYRSPMSQTTLGERAAIMNDSASSEGRASPHPITHSFTPDSLLIDVDPKGPSSPNARTSSRNANEVNLINFSLRNMGGHGHQHSVGNNERSMAVLIPRAKIKPPSRPASTHNASRTDLNCELAVSERKLIDYLDQCSTASPNIQSGLIKPNPSYAAHAASLLKSEQFRKFSLQEQRKMSQGALVSSGQAVSAIGGMRRRSTTALDPHIEPTYSGYEKSVSEVRSYDETIRCAAKTTTLYTATDTDTRASCYSCKPPSYCAYSESHGHTMGDRDGASTVYTTQGKLFRLAHRPQDDTSSTASSQ